MNHQLCEPSSFTTIAILHVVVLGWSAASAGLTFEVKSDIPFSTVVTLDPNNPPPPRDYIRVFSSLQVD